MSAFAVITGIRLRLVTVVALLGFTATLTPVIFAASIPDWLAGLSRPAVPPTGEPGQWLRWNNQYGTQTYAFRQNAITPAQATAWDRQMLEIVAFLKQTPVLNSPRGFHVGPSGHLTVTNADVWIERPKQAPIAGGVKFAPWLPESVAPGRDGQLARKSGAETNHFRIEMNYVYPLSSMGWMEDKRGRFFALRKDGEFAGFPIYGGDLVLTRPGRALFVPVSRERVLKAYLEHNRHVPKDHNRNVEAWVKYHRTNPPPNHPIYNALRAYQSAEQQLKSLTPAERTKPAWASKDSQQPPVPEGTPGAMPLVEINPKFFDPALPRHAIQIILVRDLADIGVRAHRNPGDKWSLPPRVQLSILQQTDWRVFADKFLK